MIDSNNYVEEVLRSEPQDVEKMMERLSDIRVLRLLHASMGFCTEVGEFQDMLKKHIFQGRGIDFINAKEELGDIMWYVGLAVDVLRTTLNEVMTGNIKKLRLRYPEKFSAEKSENRDLPAERKLLEEIK